MTEKLLRAATYTVILGVFMLPGQMVIYGELSYGTTQSGKVLPKIRSQPKISLSILHINIYFRVNKKRQYGAFLLPTFYLRFCPFFIHTHPAFILGYSGIFLDALLCQLFLAFGLDDGFSKLFPGVFLTF